MTLPRDHAERIARARRSLAGLSVGDAFGERFFASPATVESLIEQRAIPGGGRWHFTDDTVMALSIVEVLEDFGAIRQDELARAFSEKYVRDPARGYGPMAHRILSEVSAGFPWLDVASSVFDGSGSMGNGGAMRAGPIGAYFSEDLGRVVTNADLSAQVTHTHPEGRAGAIAVAVAAAVAARAEASATLVLEAVLDLTPSGETHASLVKASELPREYDVRTAVAALGNGARVISQDTVPFAIWCACRHVDDFEEALWTTVAGLGDRDTTCAIVGSIVGARPTTTVPPEWLASREPLSVMGRA